MPPEPPSPPTSARRSSAGDSAASTRARGYFEQFAAEYDEAARSSGWRLNGRLVGALAGVGTGAAGGRPRLWHGHHVGRAAPGVARRPSWSGWTWRTPWSSGPLPRCPGATVVRADVRDFVGGTAAGTFDVVTAIGGFEFTPGLPGLLDGVRRMVAPGGHLVFTYEPVLAGWPPQEQRVETNLGSNGLELTTYRWEPGEVATGFDGWEPLRSELLVAYLRDELPTVYGWLHYRRR